jgi:hypothetical protein
MSASMTASADRTPSGSRYIEVSANGMRAYSACTPSMV